MLVRVLTIFPEMFPGPLGHSIVGRAQANGRLKLQVINLRDFAHDLHRTTDDYPFGGGPGMVMKAEPIFEATEAVLKGLPSEEARNTPVVLMSPQGRPLTQQMAQELSEKPGMIAVCGHYQGVDERVRAHLATHEISIGDYVLSGGELAAMVMIDVVARLLPGVVGCHDSIDADSITSGLLQHPLYTRPQVYRDWEVPEVLLSGNHQEIARWRRQQALLATWQRRPYLLDAAELSQEDIMFLEGLGYHRNE